MTPTPVSLFNASDGRPFEVHWASEANSRELWHWNDSHQPRAVTPFYGWLMSQHAGRLRAFAEAGVDPPAMFRGFEIHQGFMFARLSPLLGEEQQRFTEKSTALSRSYGGPCKVFEQFSLPRVREACRSLQAAGIDTPTSELARVFTYAFYLTQVAGMTVFQPFLGRLTTLLQGHFPLPEIQLLVQEVGQGANSATVDSDRAIAHMAKIAAANPAIARLLDGPGPGVPAALERTPGAEALSSELAAYFETYGWRTQTWDLQSPTLREEPEFAIAMIRRSMRNPRDPDELRAGALAVRENAIRRINAALGDDQEIAAATKQCVDALEDYIAVREGRALWQLIGIGSLRHALLRKGTALAESGAIADAADIFFLVGEEIDDAVARPAKNDDLRSLVSARRAERASWDGVTPPRLISASPERLAHGQHPEGSRDLLRGLPASRGIVSGPARVILDIDDADQMEVGEILVCVMTSPPWTPVIGLASALVTDSGMALSHSAIAAREYGIPCVVGTGDGTLRVRTGDVLTVDGDAGTVTIISRA